MVCSSGQLGAESCSVGFIDRVEERWRRLRRPSHTYLRSDSNMQRGNISRMKLRDRNMEAKKKKPDPLISLHIPAYLLLPQLFHYKYWLLAELGHSRGSERQSEEGGEFCK